MPDIDDMWDDDEDIAPFVRPRKHTMPDDSRAKHVAVSPRQAENEQLRRALELALEYWAHRQQRYKNRHPAWVQAAHAALGGDR